MAFKPKTVRSMLDVVNHRKVTCSKYKAVFGSSVGREVLEDMAKSAGMFDDRIGADDRETNQLLGERRFFLKITKMLSMTEEQINAQFLPRGDDQ
jgi:hypothetical protein